MSSPSSANDPGVPVDGLPGGPNYKGSQGYSDYVSPLDYNSYYDDGGSGAPYDIPDMNAAAASRKDGGDPRFGPQTQAAASGSGGRQRDPTALASDDSNMRQVYAPQPGNFNPDAPLDASQVNDWRNQFGPRAPIQPGSYGLPRP